MHEVEYLVIVFTLEEVHVSFHLGATKKARLGIHSFGFTVKTFSSGEPVVDEFDELVSVLAFESLECRAVYIPVNIIKGSL